MIQMEWEPTPAVTETRGMELHSSSDRVTDGDLRHGFLAGTQFSRSRLNKPDFNMNLLPGTQGSRGAIPDVPETRADHEPVSVSVNRPQVAFTELTQFETLPVGMSCNSSILQHWTKLGEPAVICTSSPSPGSIGVPSGEQTQSYNSLAVSPHMRETSPGNQSQQSTLHHIGTTGTVIAVNHLGKSIVLRHGEKLLKVTNYACLDRNFNLAFISDLARKAPSADKANSDNVNYSGYSDYTGHIPSADSGHILANTTVEVANLQLPHGYSSVGSHVNKLFLSANEEQQMMVIDVDQGVNFVSPDSPKSVLCTTVGPSSRRSPELVRESHMSPSHPCAPRVLTLADINSGDQNIVPIAVADPQTEAVTMETDIGNGNSTQLQSSNGAVSESLKHIPEWDTSNNNCRNVETDMVEDGRSLSKPASKAMPLPSSHGSDVQSNTPALLITNRNRISSNSLNGSSVRATPKITPSSYKHVNNNTAFKAFSTTNTHSNSDSYPTTTKDSNVCIKTNGVNQHTVTFCMPSSRTVLDKSLLSPLKARAMKLTSLGRKQSEALGLQVEPSSLLLPLHSHASLDNRHPSTRNPGTLSILPSRDNSNAPLFTAKNLKLSITGSKATADITPHRNEDGCLQNCTGVCKSSNVSSSSGVLRSLARQTEMLIGSRTGQRQFSETEMLTGSRTGQRQFSETEMSLVGPRTGQSQFSETEMSLTGPRTGQRQFPETENQVEVCSRSTTGVSPAHSCSTVSDNLTISRSLTLNSFNTVTPLLKTFNPPQPVTLSAPFPPDNSASTSMDNCDVTMSPASLDTSLVSSDTGISSSTSLPSSSSLSSDGSCAAANFSTPASSPSYTSATTTSSAETSTAADTGRRLRIRHQRRFLPEKPRHKRQTLQDMTRPLKQWLYKHRENPYPTKLEKVELVKHSHMSLTQVSNWFANARRRLKNTVQGEDLSWARRIKDYNQYAEGNAELFSVPSSDDEEEWDSDDGDNVHRDRDSYTHPAICESTMPSPVPTLTSSFSDPALASPIATQSLLASPNIAMRCSPSFDEQQGAYQKYKHSILQRYLQDASQQIPIPDDDMMTSRARHRNLSSSTGSHDFEYLSTSSVSSPSHEMPHDSFDEFSEEFETIAIRRRVPDNSSTQNTEDMYWKEIGAALALASLARSHISK